MKSYVLDASAVLRFTDREPGFERVRDLLGQAAQGEAKLAMSAVSWSEVVHAVMKRGGAQAETILDNLAALPFEVVSVDAATAAEAGRLKARCGIRYADAFAAALALRQPDSILVTADNDFRELPRGAMATEFLPGQ